ncbi:MAG: T9SS type A sorting domain-containing protein [Candidatus Cloacimonas sp.]
MKKYWLIILALTFITAIFANGSRYEVVAYSEDFESGATGWTHYDGAVSPNNWHIYNAGGTQGNVWWMGDPALAQGANIGGYYNHQYLVLDTPARTLTAANATLTFKLRHNLESPTGATAPYTGWDACNVRISTNGGTTWTPITGTPTYDMTSAYSFGFEHGEGAGIPGWGGVREWTTATFDLSAYVGQSVKIRFAFASDPAYCTSDAPAMFGMMVDDISVGGYSNNGVDDGQMTWTSLVPQGGDIWNLGTDTTAPSPTHCMINQNASGSYNINMMNYLVSPPITLPTSGDIRADFMVMGSFTDPNTFPDVDYWGWEFSVNNGVSWHYMSNPNDDPNGNNYVYSDAPTVWTSMIEGYSLDGYITNYHGQTAIFRWFFKSDADTPSGTGIRIDDFKIYNDIIVAAPENLEGTVSENSVSLTWAAPGSGGGGGEEGWIYYCGDPSANAIGTDAAADFDVAAKWDPLGDTNSIYPYVGMNITKIKFVPAEPTSMCSYSVRIWTGASGVMVYDQPVSTITEDGWNEVILTTPYTIPSGTAVWAGFRCNTTGGFPAGCDAGPQIDGYGNMIRFNGVWGTLIQQSATLTYNWNIQVYVADANGKEYVLGELPMNDTFAEGTLGVGYNEPTRDREVTAYKIYRDSEYLAQVNGDVLTYTDANVAGGTHTYYVTAMYGTNESSASNTITIFVLPENYFELHHDDGTSELGFSVGAAKQMAVKFSRSGQFSVSYIKVYVDSIGTAPIIVRVFDASGTGETPGGQAIVQYQYPLASIVQGWNYIALPTVAQFTDAPFYVGILETTNACKIGLDTSSNGFSYKKISTNWEPVTNGEIMIRPIVMGGQAGEDPILPTIVLDAKNYPNPFNPETTIHFSLPESGPTSVKVYNLKGQLIRTLVNGNMNAGNQKIVWNGMDDNNQTVASGLYFYRVTNVGKSITRKMLLSK